MYNPAKVLFSKNSKWWSPWRCHVYGVLLATNVSNIYTEPCLKNINICQSLLKENCNAHNRVQLLRFCENDIIGHSKLFLIKLITYKTSVMPLFGQVTSRRYIRWKLFKLRIFRINEYSVMMMRLHVCLSVAWMGK